MNESKKTDETEIMKGERIVTLPTGGKLCVVELRYLDAFEFLKRLEKNVTPLVEILKEAKALKTEEGDVDEAAAADLIRKAANVICFQAPELAQWLVEKCAPEMPDDLGLSDFGLVLAAALELNLSALVGAGKAIAEGMGALGLRFGSLRSLTS